jgi:hypothetical protein
LDNNNICTVLFNAGGVACYIVHVCAQKRVKERGERGGNLRERRRERKEGGGCVWNEY